MARIQVYEDVSLFFFKDYLVVIDNSVFIMSKNMHRPGSINQYYGEKEDCDFSGMEKVSLQDTPLSLRKAIALKIEDMSLKNKDKIYRSTVLREIL